MFIMPVRDSDWQASNDRTVDTNELLVWTGVQYGNRILYNTSLDKNMISVKQVRRDSICVRK